MTERKTDAELLALLAGESVAVCKDHTSDVIGDHCVVCENERLRTAGENAGMMLRNIARNRKRHAPEEIRDALKRWGLWPSPLREAGKERTVSMRPCAMCGQGLDDVGELLSAAGLEPYARPKSAHRVIQDELVPRVEQLRAENERLREALYVSRDSLGAVPYMLGESGPYLDLGDGTERYGLGWVIDVIAGYDRADRTLGKEPDATEQETGTDDDTNHADS